MGARVWVLIAFGILSVACGSSDDGGGASPSDSGAVSDMSSTTDTASADVPTAGDTSAHDSDASLEGDAAAIADAPVCETTLNDGSSCPATCSGACVDPSSDPRNCGGCGTTVCALEICLCGAPACAPGYAACEAGGGCLGCKDVQSDHEHCGDCATKCGELEVCAAGACWSPSIHGCAAPTILCGSDATGWGCYDPTSDVGNCGACGHACAPGQYCRSSTCVDYTGAPGCTSCPCAACTSPTDQCCTYAGETICASGGCPTG